MSTVYPKSLFFYPPHPPGLKPFMLDLVPAGSWGLGMGTMLEYKVFTLNPLALKESGEPDLQLIWSSRQYTLTKNYKTGVPPRLNYLERVLFISLNLISLWIYFFFGCTVYCPSPLSPVGSTIRRSWRSREYSGKHGWCCQQVELQ